jgi:hypothetical protein
MVAGAIAHPQIEGFSIPEFVLGASSSLLGIVSYFLYRSENGNCLKLVFLNFALFFGINVVRRPLYDLAMGCFVVTNPWIDFYYHEYSWLLYYLQLSLSIFYLVADQTIKSRLVYTKYLATFAVVASMWLIVFYPFLLDAKYLYNVADYRNFLAVRESMTRMQSRGSANPSNEEIASCTPLTMTDVVPQGENIDKHKERYVAQLLDYVAGDNYALLIFKPLWLRCSGISLLNVFVLLWCVAYQYYVDRPGGAYMEKIVWCFLPYCVFEALHLFAFTKVTQWNALQTIMDVGICSSILVMWIQLFLFGFRLRFIKTIEGSYYEHRLLSDASRITRWRDAFDNWILKQFMNPGELDRRFLTERREQE